MTTLRFDLPLPPQRGNARDAHWAGRYRSRKAYWKHLDMLVLVKRLPRPPAEPWPAAIMTLHFRVWNTHDTDNLVSRVKDCADWLVSRGYVAGDRPEQLRYRAMPTQAIDRRNPGLELTLEAA